MAKFKVGDTVRRTRGEHGGMLVGAIGTVTRVSENGSVALAEFRGWGHDDDNLELATESKQGEKVMRKTYKLLKDMPGCKAGTLFQEMCEDGTQPYRPLEDVPGVDLELSDRIYVEDNPKWFVEVFQVEPQYMTREELDQFEAFKASKAPAKRPLRKTAAKKTA